MATTIHRFSSPRILPAYLRSNGVLVSISDADRAPELEYAAQSITASRSRPYGSRATASEALVRLGRIHPDKGTARAIEIARRADRPLVRCGQVQDERYFIDEIEPHVAGDSVRYLGSVGGLERAQVRCEAACLLHPIAFGELFGLSIVESMLCRTPVVAYARGSMPEVIQEGVTGVLADSVESAVAGVKRAVRLGRAACRQAAEQRISADEVVDS